MNAAVAPCHTRYTPKKRHSRDRQHYEEVTDSTAPVIDFRQSLHDVSSSAPPRTRSRSGWTEALLRQQKHRCQLRFQHKKTPSFIAVSRRLSLYRRVERSAGTGGQRHRRSGDRRDSLLSLSLSLSRSRSLSLSLSPSPSPSPSPSRSLSLSLSPTHTHTLS